MTSKQPIPPEETPFVVGSWHKFFASAGFTDKQGSHYTELFKEHAIELDMVKELTHDVLTQMGAWKAGHRIKILRMQRRVVDRLLEGDTEMSPVYLLPNSHRASPLRGTPPGVNKKARSSMTIKPYRQDLGATSIPARQRGVKKVDALGDVSGGKIGKSNSAPAAKTSPPNSISKMSKGITTPTLDVDYSQDESYQESFEESFECIRYYVNDEIGKHKLYSNNLSLVNIEQMIRLKHKLTEPFATFIAVKEEKDINLHVVRQVMLEPDMTYYIIENTRYSTLKPRIERRLKREDKITHELTETGRKVLTSVNNPLKVDFVPDGTIILNSDGKLGLCMAPGRKKKKNAHDWDRDLAMDLDRIRNDYGCDVLVSLIRHKELEDLRILTLAKDVEALGMEYIHFPIKDKWIPHSMDELIRHVDLIIKRLTEGQTVVCHCNGGKGRSGTLVVATLVGLGHRVQDAITIVRNARSGTIRNPLQQIYVKRFKTAWIKYINKNKEYENLLLHAKWRTDQDSRDESSSDSADQLAANKGKVAQHYNKHKEEKKMKQKDKLQKEKHKQEKMIMKMETKLVAQKTKIQKKELKKEYKDIKKSGKKKKNGEIALNQSDSGNGSKGSKDKIRAADASEAESFGEETANTAKNIDDLKKSDKKTKRGNESQDLLKSDKLRVKKKENGEKQRKRKSSKKQPVTNIEPPSTGGEVSIADSE